jgi:hypothetical protein
VIFDKKAIVALGHLSILCREIRTNKLYWGSTMLKVSNKVLEGIEQGKDPVELLKSFSYIVGFVHGTRQQQLDSLYIPLGADIVR